MGKGECSGEVVVLLSRVWFFCDPMDCSPSRLLCPVGFSQARILEWVAISFSRGSSWPRDRTQVSRISGRRFNLWATREALIVATFNFGECFSSALYHPLLTSLSFVYEPDRVLFKIFRVVLFQWLSYESDFSRPRSKFCAKSFLANVSC